MPAAYPQEFRENVVRVTRSRQDGVTLARIAKDFGIHEMTLHLRRLRPPTDITAPARAGADLPPVRRHPRDGPLRRLRR
ncbi:hypothetical protein [Kocuria marina]|uniref:Transposase n=1 Tax=Kocuria marina subsp. indica TaxID=1049583 RepID=A0A1X7D9T5_9MICC|nr:hypothetical protein [Kocuria indica]RLP57701.1 hypothetical protein D9R06_08525 [Kocuria indica]SMF11481.1 hypothetical protein SAMN06296028_11011 [Kocuria indica]